MKSKSESGHLPDVLDDEVWPPDDDVVVVVTPPVVVVVVVTPPDVVVVELEELEVVCLRSESSPSTPERRPGSSKSSPSRDQYTHRGLYCVCMYVCTYVCMLTEVVGVVASMHTHAYIHIYIHT